MAELLHLLEAMRDVEHRAAFPCEPAQGHEELVRLLRRQHRGRLVHDEEAGLLKEAAHDLDPLALADREVRDEGARLEGQAVLRRHPRDPFAEGGEIERSRHRERDVLHRRECLEEREVLEDHADPEPAGGRGIRHRHAPALPPEAPRGRLERAVDDLDQGRLAGPVLAEQGVYPPRAELEAHAVVRGEVAEALHDVDGFQKVATVLGVRGVGDACGVGDVRIPGRFVR